MSKPLLPVVSEEIVGAYKRSFDQDPDTYTAEALRIFRSENPFLYEVVNRLADEQGQDKAATLSLALAIYSLLRQQAEVDELNSNV